MNIWEAFQGFVYAPKDSALNSNCLLTGETFNLTDKNYIIPIYAYGNRSKTHAETCTWSFHIPSGYKLKVVVASINLHERDTLNITGLTNISVKSRGNYTIDGEQITIFYNKNHETIPYIYEGNGFEGYVTLIRPQIPKEVTCRYDKHNDTITYTNYDEEEGYENDVVSKSTQNNFLKCNSDL